MRYNVEIKAGSEDYNKYLESLGYKQMLNILISRIDRDEKRMLKMVGAGHALLDGVMQVAQNQNAGQEHIQSNLGHGNAEQGAPDTINRKYDGQSLDDHAGSAVPATGIGLAVILFHNLVDVGSRTDFDFGLHNFGFLFHSY